MEVMWKVYVRIPEMKWIVYGTYMASHSFESPLKYPWCKKVAA